MSYIAKVLQPGERVVHVGRLHWIMYLPSIVVLCIGLAVLLIPTTAEYRTVIYGISAVLVLIAALSAFRAWFKQFTTEIAVTDRRIIYKTGFVARETAEPAAEGRAPWDALSGIVRGSGIPRLR